MGDTQGEHGSRNETAERLSGSEYGRVGARVPLAGLMQFSIKSLTSGIGAHSLLSLVGNGIARLGSLIVAVAVAAVFGANETTDALYLALAVTLYVFDVARIAFEGAVIPTVANYLTQGRSAVEEFLGASVKYWLMASGVLSVTILAVGLPTSWQSTAIGAQAVRYGAILVLILPPLGVSGLGNAVLMAEKRFFVPAVSNAARPLFAVAGLAVLHTSWGLWSLIVGYLVGALVQTAMVLGVLHQRGYRLRLAGSLRQVHAPLKLALPIVIGGLLINLNPIVDRFIVAIALPASNVTVFENAFRIYGALTSLVYSSVGVVLISHWSGMQARAQHARLTQSVRIVGVLSVLGLIPVTGLLILFAEPLVGLALGYGAYTARDVAVTAATLTMFVLGLWPFFAAGMGSRFLYATGNTAIALTTSSMAVAINLIADIFLLQWLGLRGIALSTSFTYLLIAAYVIYVLRVKLGRLRDRPAVATDGPEL